MQSAASTVSGAASVPQDITAEGSLQAGNSTVSGTATGGLVLGRDGLGGDDAPFPYEEEPRKKKKLVRRIRRTKQPEKKTLHLPVFDEPKVTSEKKPKEELENLEELKKTLESAKTELKAFSETREQEKQEAKGKKEAKELEEKARIEEVLRQEEIVRIEQAIKKADDELALILILAYAA